MAAATQIHLFSGVTGLTFTDITAQECRFKRADDGAPDFAAPITIPSTGANYSWRKHTKLWVDSGLNGWIANLRWFAESEPLDWQGQITLYVKSSDTYTQGSVSDETTILSSASDANNC